MSRSTDVTAWVTRPLEGGGDLLPVFERLRAGRDPWLLDSALPSARLGRQSFAGADPYLVVRARGSSVELDCRRAVRPDLDVGTSRCDADPLEVLRSLMPSPPAAPGAEADFLGGAVVVLGYGLADQLEPIGLRRPGASDFPDATFLFVDRLVSLDCATGRLAIHALGFAPGAAEARRRAERAADELAAVLARPPAARRTGRAIAPQPAFDVFDPPGYAKAVDGAKGEIAAGNAYQVCLTHRMDRDFGGDPWDLYRRLRRHNPAPFACYLELSEGVIVGNSPERFLRLDGNGRVESRPIKGTRPRDADAEVDRGNRARLLCSAKDRAENLMIVDLVRNDLGRVCETGSVRVPELMAIESYASVHQMVSTVSGRLRCDRDAVDLVRAAFPPGSMTGAPKIAAMRILDRLERVPRGVYSGALGYLDVRGGLDLCVVIRTVFVRDGRASVHAGGGVVADSDPLGEYREALDKARPLLAEIASRH